MKNRRLAPEQRKALAQKRLESYKELARKAKLLREQIIKSKGTDDAEGGRSEDR